jgi:sterol desaturase/sphingolipid hydroxylase (fatty acid hydroxylase superfamily)
MLEYLLPFVHAELRLLPIFGLYFVAERLIGAKRFDWRAWAFDWQYWLLWVLGNSVILAVLAAAGGDLKTWAAGHRLFLNLGRLHPVVRQLLLLLTFDLFYYWFHRVQHTTALWPQHAVHHSAPHLNAATAFRHHILENAVRFPFVDVPLMFIFVHSVWADAGLLTQLATGFVAYLGIFAHSNLRIGFGPLNWLIVSPQTHRIHHSIEARHWNRNFAAYFPVIDVVFGTYYHPRKDEYPDTGVPGIGFTLNSLPAAFMYPFREWRAMATGARVVRGQAEAAGVAGVTLPPDAGLGADLPGTRPTAAGIDETSR